MLDKNGNEIKVGDTVMHDYNRAKGIVSEVGDDYIICSNWSDDMDAGIKFYLPYYLEIIKPAEQPKQQPPSLSQLKAKAKLEIEALIKKHTNIINQAGGNLGMHVGFHDVRTIGSEQPSQLVDVVVTVTI